MDVPNVPPAADAGYFAAQDPQFDFSPTTEFFWALATWEKLLGPSHVLCDESTLDEYSKTTLPHGTRPRAVLRPGSTAEVSRLVAVADEHRVPLYPISRGKNWGYGDRCAVTDGQVIVDLSRMNRIVEVNPELGYAVVEPGVTQGQLYQHLRENSIPLWLDGTGAGPDASIVGNTLERGFGHSPYGNRFEHICGMEVVLADGRLLRTGFGAYENARAARVFPAGIGPWLDGLFTQSNLGIVVRMGIWLMPAPAVCQGFALKVRGEDQIAGIVEALRPLRLMGVVRSTVHIANDLRVISARRRYPWELTGGATPLPDYVRRRLRKEAGLGAWNVMGGLYGTRETVAAARKTVRRAFRGVARVHFFGPRKLKWGLKAAKFAARLGIGQQMVETLHNVESAYELLRGEPVSEHLEGVFWRSRRRPDDHAPNPTDAGVYWLSPVLPMTASHCREVLDLVEPIFREHRFEPLVTMTSVTDRALVCVLSVCYDKEDPEDTARAAACYEALFDAVTRRGYLPYRSGIQSMGKLGRGSETYWEIVGRLKAALDPRAIFAPGRYQPTQVASQGNTCATPSR